MLAIQVQGLELAKRRLEEAGRKIDPVLRGALNTTATKSRQNYYTKALSPAIGGPRTRRAIRVKRARRGLMNARLIPSAAGIPVPYYKGWWFEPINLTRARVWVRGPDGMKVAAGFVNPSSKNQLPLATRSAKAKRGGGEYRKNYKQLQLALGPSAAYWFRKLTTAKTVRFVNADLQREFERRIVREISKGLK